MHFDYPDVPCGRLAFSAFVATPQTPGIFALFVGDRLDIAISPVRGMMETAMLYKENLAVGTVGGVFASKLNRCLAKGFKFEAVVESIAGGTVLVRVAPQVV